ncbi:MAG: hypothetical protein Q4F79_13225 [Eubacteriales bacterium]|nr:hypothetical protein [Eubacteriales bacterium]
MDLFRLLRADEIECRVQQVKKSRTGEYGFSLLLYKDARCDMNILDETVGATNWMRQHTRDNANCIVSIWDEEKNQWVGKEDVGTESNTEAAKGLASDSFKRACVNWGIGRELYSAPFIWITARDDEVFENQGKTRLKPNAKFRVKEIEYDESRKITRLVIVDSRGTTRFCTGSQEAPANKQQDRKIRYISENDVEWVVNACQIVCGMDTWQRGLRKATGYDNPNNIREEDFPEIKRRLEAAMMKAQTP